MKTESNAFHQTALAMEENQEATNLDIFHLELQIREKLYELQWKSDALEETKAELAEARHFAYDLKSSLEDERRSSAEIQHQLEAAMGIVRRLEEEKAQSQIELTKLQMHNELTSRERTSLIEQARIAKTENSKLKQKAKDLELGIASKDTHNKILEKSLIEITDEMTCLIDIMNRNMEKIQQEHKLLRHNVEGTIELNKRLQTVGLCAHAIHQNDSRKIRKLKEQLASQSVETASKNKNSEDPQIKETRIQMEQLLKELTLKVESDKEFNDKLNAIHNSINTDIVNSVNQRDDR
ncbi:filamin A-interacting protein 1-like [Cephus cinctus]|uniref:Filamin A-interacting protein 1-like n=1 Tax=Cephus cinctus TaxID=211228 RepID=A0AAJ7BZW9_CEPCN|nr:filamin A-interacting protein 1-like [Cephus cinctus]